MFKNKLLSFDGILLSHLIHAISSSFSSYTLNTKKTTPEKHQCPYKDAQKGRKSA